MNWFSKKEEPIKLLPDLPGDNTLIQQGENNDFNNIQYAAEVKNTDYPRNEFNNEPILGNLENAQQSNLDFGSNNETAYRRSGPVLSHSSLSMPSLDPMPSVNQLPSKSPFSRNLEPPSRYNTKEESTVYIRLDKFQSTKEALDNIKEKIEDIDKTILKIKEVREKEEKEITEWEREIQIIKTRLEAIDSNLFEKLS